MPRIQIYRDGVPLMNPKYSSAVFNGQVMGENKITVELKSTVPLDLKIGDYIQHRSRYYTISDTPGENQQSDKAYDYLTYNMVFEAPEYKLYNKKFRHLNSGTFAFTGNALEVLTLIIQVAGGNWKVGTVDNTIRKTIQFDKDTCRSAITKVAQEFELEYEFTADFKVNLKDTIGTLLPNVVLSYGKNKGLKGLSRQPIDSSSFGTRFFGYGSTDNLPANYRNGATELQFEGFFVDSPFIGDYPEPIEQDVSFPDIKPERTGTISLPAKTSTGWSVRDSTLDFDLNDVIVDGSARIVFKTGDLTGTEFEITGYDAVQKIISFNTVKFPNGSEWPNQNVVLKAGDQYTLVGIVMPDSYVKDAENRLKAATIAYGGQNDKPKVSFGLKTDKLYLKNNGLTEALTFGNKLRTLDSARHIDSILRIQQISYPLDDESEIEATITDTVSYTVTEKTISAIKNTEIVIARDERTNAQRARDRDINLRALQNLIIDPEGNYFTEKIKPGSIETLYLSVGSKYTNFALKGIAFTANVGGNPNSFKASAGQLVHFSLEVDGAGFTWQMTPFNSTTLVSTSTYYLYAKVSRNALVGDWVLDTAVRKVDSVAGYWYFQTGVLFAVNSKNVRDYEITKGMSYIVGDQITAGVLKSLDGLNFFNLNENTFNLGDATSGLDFGVTKPNTLTLKGALFQSGSGVTAPVPVYRGPYNAAATYYKGDTVTYNGATFQYVNEQPLAGQTPADNAYWDITSAAGGKGTDGTNGTNGANGNFTEFRFAKNTSSTAAPALVNNVVSPSGWATVQPAIAAGEFLWFTSVVKNGTTGALIGTWAVPARGNGIDGANGTGTQGPAGNFVEFRYQKNGSTTVGPTVETTSNTPTGWTIAQPTLNAGEYLWMISTLKNGVTGAIMNNWPTPSRVNGLPGTPGRDGTDGTNGINGTNGTNGTNGGPGPSLTYTGVYSSTKTYQGNANLVQAVYYNGSYYFTRVDAGSFSNIAPTNTAKWNAAGAQFDSVATGLLLAQLAYIDNLGVRYLSTDTPGHKRVVVDGDLNNIRLYNSSDAVIAELDDNSAIRVIPSDIPGGTTFTQIVAGLKMLAGNDISAMSAFGFYTKGNITLVDPAGIKDPLIIDFNGIRGSAAASRNIKQITLPYTVQPTDDILFIVNHTGVSAVTFPDTAITGREVTVCATISTSPGTHVVQILNQSGAVLGGFTGNQPIPRYSTFLKLPNSWAMPN